VVEGGSVNECEGNCVGGEGSYVFPDGSVYTGSWKNSRFHGKGEMQYADGEVYTGSFKKGKRHGKGSHVYPIDSQRGSLSGAVYQGPWRNDSPNGHGSFKFSSGADYEGDFENGAFHGWGVYTYVDESVYSGQFVKGQREGRGYMEMPTGDKYEGAWRNNEWDSEQGKPTYHRADGKTQEF